MFDSSPTIQRRKAINVERSLSLKNKLEKIMSDPKDLKDSPTKQIQSALSIKFLHECKSDLKLDEPKESSQRELSISSI